MWSPSKTGQIQEIENIQKSFTRKIRSQNCHNYWERLNSLKLYSLQRRRERYRILYVWKILQNIVPNVGESGITSRYSIRHGRFCVVPKPTTTASAEIQRLKEGSFCVNGPKLFNSLPKSLRNLKDVDLSTFKGKLDQFLWTVADEPQCPGYTAGRRAESNSLIQMIPACRLSNLMNRH